MYRKIDESIDFRYPGENADMEEAEEAIAICDSLRSKLKEFIGNEYFTYPINFPA